MDIDETTEAITSTLIAALTDAIEYRRNQGEWGDCTGCQSLGRQFGLYGADEAAGIKCADHTYDDHLADSYQVVLDRIRLADNHVAN